MGESIDLKKTGELLKESLSNAGYKVADIQKYLGLSCPQPIYRWYKGKALPTVDHLRALSVLLGKHMEELLVAGGDKEDIVPLYNVDWITEDMGRKRHMRITAYYSMIAGVKGYLGTFVK